MLTAVDIINALQRPQLHIEGIGRVYVEAESIVAGNSSVASRCRIDGIEGDFLLKCFYHPDFVPKHHQNILYIGTLHTFTLQGRSYATQCIVRRWVDGIALDDALMAGRCDYRRLSILFDSMALERLLCPEAHGDISPENIIIGQYRMTLIDNDATWLPEATREDITECGNPLFNHPHRTINRPTKHMDDYAIATLSTLLAAISHYAKEAPEGTDPRTVIPQILLESIITPTPHSLNLATQKLAEVDDTAHYAIATSLGGVLDSIPNLVEWLTKSIPAKDF